MEIEFSFYIKTNSGGVLAEAELWVDNNGNTSLVETFDLTYGNGNLHIPVPITRRLYKTVKTQDEYYLNIKKNTGSNTFTIISPNLSAAYLAQGLFSVP